MVTGGPQGAQMTDRSRAYESHERAVERVFRLALAVTSLHSDTEDPDVQERLAGIAAELDQVIAELRAATFGEVHGPALTDTLPRPTPNGLPAA